MLKAQKGLAFSAFKAFKTPMMFNKMQKPFQSTTGEGFVMEAHDKLIWSLLYADETLNVFSQMNIMFELDHKATDGLHC